MPWETDFLTHLATATDAIRRSTMSTFDFYSYLNKYTPELQAKALRLAGDDMDLARELYQRTATRAMAAPSARFSAGTVERFVDGLMLEVLEEMRQHIPASEA